MRKLVAILSVSALVAGGATGTALANNGKGKGSGPGGGKSCQSHGPKGKSPKGCPQPAGPCQATGVVTGPLAASPLGDTPLRPIFCAISDATGGAV